MMDKKKQLGLLLCAGMVLLCLLAFFSITPTKASSSPPKEEDPAPAQAIEDETSDENLTSQTGAYAEGAELDDLSKDFFPVIFTVQVVIVALPLFLLLFRIIDNIPRALRFITPTFILEAGRKQAAAYTTSTAENKILEVQKIYKLCHEQYDFKINKGGIKDFKPVNESVVQEINALLVDLLRKENPQSQLLINQVDSRSLSLPIDSTAWSKDDFPYLPSDYNKERPIIEIDKLIEQLQKIGCEEENSAKDLKAIIQQLNNGERKVVPPHSVTKEIAPEDSHKRENTGYSFSEKSSVYLGTYHQSSSKGGYIMRARNVVLKKDEKEASLNISMLYLNFFDAKKLTLNFDDAGQLQGFVYRILIKNIAALIDFLNVITEKTTGTTEPKKHPSLLYDDNDDKEDI